MLTIKIFSVKLLMYILLISLVLGTDAKSSEDSSEGLPEPLRQQKMADAGAGGAGAAYLFAEELKMTLERYLFGMCPLTYKMVGPKNKNATALTCDLDPEQQELAGRLATLALRAHSASRTDCTKFGAALANTLGELARTAANRAALTASNNEVNKKRKLSKSQKAKIQAKQRTALAVKKKAAAVAAAAAAKMAS